MCAEKYEDQAMDTYLAGEIQGHEGGFPRAWLIHCILDVLTPAISPNVGNCIIYGSGGLASCSPLGGLGGGGTKQ